jgi:hypothetical protein
MAFRLPTDTQYPDPDHDTFDRQPIADATVRVRIQSTCKNCGFVLTGSVNEGLPEQEQDHAQECAKSKKKPKSASRTSSSTSSAA